MHIGLNTKNILDFDDGSMELPTETNSIASIYGYAVTVWSSLSSLMQSSNGPQIVSLHGDNTWSIERSL